jgi:hypothetical protein
VGKINEQLLSKMTPKNREATWAIIGGKDISAFNNVHTDRRVRVQGMCR